MKPSAWLKDTIALRFAATITLAVIVTLTLVRLFFVFGGNWAQPEIAESGLPGEVAGIVRVIEAAPPQIRQTLLTEASTSKFRSDWYDATSQVSAGLAQASDDEAAKHLMEEILDDAHRSVRIFRPDDQVSAMPALSKLRTDHPKSFFLAIKLKDDSWLVFTSFNRTWGLNREKRWLIWVVLSALSTAVVSAIAARRLSRPIKQFADSVRIFGLNPQAPALVETGPQELRQVIRTFNAMQAQIQKFIAYRTTMLAAISHDLRTPLTRMRLRGEYIEAEEEQKKLFHDVDEMQAMVDGALAFFRDDASDEATTAFDLPGVLRTIANDYADQGIEIDYAGPAHTTCHGRPFALKRAFTNVIENAIRYATPPEIELSCDGNTVIVAVRDRGPGIPSEALDRVFTPYYRLDKSRNRMTGGVGLGLTAAQTIIRGHGGEITLINRPGGGLEARVALPLTGEVAPK